LETGICFAPRIGELPVGAGGLRTPTEHFECFRPVEKREGPKAPVSVESVHSDRASFESLEVIHGQRVPT